MRREQGIAEIKRRERQRDVRTEENQARSIEAERKVMVGKMEKER